MEDACFRDATKMNEFMKRAIEEIRRRITSNLRLRRYEIPKGLVHTCRQNPRLSIDKWLILSVEQ